MLNRRSPYALAVLTGSVAHAQWAGLNLDPSLFPETSVALGGSGTQVVGYVIPDGVLQSHASLWPGPPYTWVDLNPTGATSSAALGSTGTQQVGNATFGSLSHAGLWSGTAASWIDLNPTGAAGSRVEAFA